METHAEPAELVYHLRPTDPGAHIFTVTLRVDQPHPDGQVFSLPAWIPGSYLVRDYSRHVLSVTGNSETGPVALNKLDKSTWQAEPVRGPLVIKAEIYANDMSVRGAYLDGRQAFVNGVCLFFRVHGQEDSPCVLHIDPPARVAEEDWQLATSLRRQSGTDGGFGAFAAADYDTLIDQPVLLGALSSREFKVAGVPHRIYVAGRHEADLDRMVADLAIVCGWHADLFGGVLPMDRYNFLVTVLNAGYGGLEHRDSSALICARGDLPRAGATGVSSEYRKFLGLASHEYFHLWNVKRIKPSAFSPYQLDRENYTRQLWLFEGITSYYDDLALLRSGLISTDSYLELLGRSLTRVYRSGGRRRQTLEDASFDAWIKFYRQDENAPNAILSYYTKGAMVALCLDLELRLRTAGQVTLDFVMRALWAEYGENGEGLPEGGFERFAEAVAGVSLQEFFHQMLRSTVDPPVGILLAQFGVRLHLRSAESGDDPGGNAAKRDQPRPWLGIGTQAVHDRVLIKHVLADGPAASAGISAGDELLAINDVRVTPANVENIIQALEIGSSARLHVFRRDELLSGSADVLRPPRDTVWLSLDDDADEESLARRAQWLG